MKGRWAGLIASAACAWGLSFNYDVPAALSTPLQAYLGYSENDYSYLLSSLYSVYSIPNIVLPIASSFAVQKYGKREIWIACLAAVISGQIAFALGIYAQSRPVMIGGRLLLGFGSEILWIFFGDLVTRQFQNDKVALALASTNFAAVLGSVANTFIIPRLVFAHGVVFTTWLVTITSVLVCGSSGVVLARVDMNTSVKDLPSQISLVAALKWMPTHFWYLSFICFARFGMTTFNNSAQQFLATTFYRGDETLSGSVVGLTHIIAVCLILPFGWLCEQARFKKSPIMLVFGYVIYLVAHIIFLLRLMGPVIPVSMLGVSNGLFNAALFPFIAYTILNNRSGIIGTYEEISQEDDELQLEDVHSSSASHQDVHPRGTESSKKNEQMLVMGYGITSSLLNLSFAAMPMFLAVSKTIAGFSGMEVVFVAVSISGLLVSTQLSPQLSLLHRPQKNAPGSPSARCLNSIIVEVLSISGTWEHNYILPVTQPSVFTNGTLPELDFCSVDIYLSHPNTNDKVLLSVWLPPKDSWNGRFLATGGGGFDTGLFELITARGVEQGYATASTDGGHARDNWLDGGWAVDGGGMINMPLFKNFASRSLYDMGVVGKAITEAYYGKEAHHSYWTGCSTGGRQGYMMAQKYPELFDGILANAPAIHFSRFVPSDLWPQIVMQQSGSFVSQCIFEGFVNATLDACDENDGVKDGVIMDPLACDFDPSSIVGQEVECAGEKETITKAMADIVIKISEGPKSPSGERLWYGMPPSTPLAALSNTKSIDEKNVGLPFPIAESWVKHIVLRNPDFDWKTMTYEDFAWIFAQSSTRFDPLVDTSNPDLSQFRDAGGKLLTFHGIIDDIIPVGGTIQYRQRVEKEMGGLEAVDGFYRLFLAPGVGHCGLGTGPVPTDPLASLISWVEEGKAPDFLHASTTDSEGDLVQRNICRYPYAQQYTGKDAKGLDGWECNGEVMEGLKTPGANLDSLFWNVDLPEKLPPLSDRFSKKEVSGKDEL